jgi:PAS domain S-box-containing protein
MKGTDDRGPGAAGGPPPGGAGTRPEDPLDPFFDDAPSSVRRVDPPRDFLGDDPIPTPASAPPEEIVPTFPPPPAKGSARPRVPPASLDFALLRGALEEIPLGVATTRSGLILYANAALERLYGSPPGGLEQKHVAVLFDHDTFLRISQRLDEKRIFDGRVKTRGLDGRTLDAEVHAEWYSSEQLGIGGFLVFRDVSLEVGALGRIIDQLGGALFRVRVEDGSLEYVSTSIMKLTGLESITCVEHPVLLTNLVSTEERERLLFLYKRVLSGEVTNAGTQVSLRRPDGRTRVLQIRATGRRDTSGAVRHIDGVVTDVSREAQEAALAAQLEAPPSGHLDPPPRRREAAASLAPAVLELAQDLLREASQHLHSLGRSLGQAQQRLGALTDQAARGELADRLDAMTRSFAAASALNRRVRHALAGSSAAAPLADVLDRVRQSLAPVIGESVITLSASGADNALLDQRVDECTLALTYLALRAFRLAGSGSLRIEAVRVAPLPPDPKARTRAPRADAPDTLVKLSAAASPESSIPAQDVSSELQTISPRHQADQAFTAAKQILAAAGASIEVDDAAFDEACTAVRFRR